MKFSVNTTRFILFFAAAVLIFSCRKREIVVETVNDPVIFSVIASHNSVEQSVSGRAVTSDDKSFHQGSQIGIYATESSQMEVELADVVNSNIGYNNPAGSTQWNSITAASAIRFLPDDIAMNFFAYHPYTAQEGSTVVFDNASGAVATLLYTLPLNQSSDASLVDADLMWGYSHGVSQSLGVVKLEFQHKLSKLFFTVFLGNEWGSEQFRVSRIEVIGGSLSQTARLRLSSGVIESSQGVATTIYCDYGSSTLLLSEHNAQKCEFIVIPKAASSIEIKLIGSGSVSGEKEYKATLGAFELKEATQRNIALHVNKNSTLTVQVSPTIAPWDVIADIGMEAI